MADTLQKQRMCLQLVIEQVILCETSEETSGLTIHHDHKLFISCQRQVFGNVELKIWDRYSFHSYSSDSYQFRCDAL